VLSVKDSKKVISITAKRIKNLREWKNETQNDLANILGVSKQSISKIEQDKISLTLENIKKIADHYDVSIDWITGRIDEKNNPTEILDILSNYIGYTSRDPFPFENNRLKDDDPFVSLEINAALHEYLIGTVKARNILKYDDLDNGKDIYDGYIGSIKRKFLEDMTLLNYRGIIPLVEYSSLRTANDLENPVL
jgi:transcriptional regulator with XRE-family HTH domain